MEKTIQKKDKTLGFLLVSFFLALYSLFAIGHFGGDGYGDFLTARSIVKELNISLGDTADQIDEVLAIKPLSEVSVIGRDGKLYNSRNDIGFVLLIVPFVAMGYISAIFISGFHPDFLANFFASFLNPFVCAFTVYFVFRISRLLSLKQKTSTVIAFIFGLSTMYPVYARTSFSDPSLVLWVLICVYYLFKFFHDHKVSSAVRMLLFSVFSVFLKPYAILFLGIFICFLAWEIFKCKLDERLKKKVVMYSFVTLLCSIPIIFIFNWYIYGSVTHFGNREGVHTVKHIASSPNIIKGLFYYLLSPGKGFFWYNLSFVCLFSAFGAVPRNKRKEVLVLCCIAGINVLFFSQSFRRGSLFSWGPRYLLPTLGMLIFLLGFYYEYTLKAWKKWLLIVLSCIGFIINIPCFLLNSSRFFFFVKEKLQLDEYLVNFVPDLSPIRGVWEMLCSKVSEIVYAHQLPFIYNPDYKLVAANVASMNGYNYFDTWFTKIIHFAPSFTLGAYCIAALLLVSVGVTFFLIIRNLTIVEGGSSG